MLNLWYKNAVINCADVETFMDSHGDGIGDFGGLTGRLDHIEALGAACVWLLPFYPTPNQTTATTSLIFIWSNRG